MEKKKANEFPKEVYLRWNEDDGGFWMEFEDIEDTVNNEEREAVVGVYQLVDTKRVKRTVAVETTVSGYK